MIRMKSLGDGNCLYNTEAIWLVYAYRQHLLTPLWQDPDFVKNVHALLREIKENNPWISLSELGEGPSAQSVEAAFNQLIKELSVDHILDWGVLQELMAPALRTLVIRKIVNDLAIREKIKAELTPAVRGIVEISTPEGIELGSYFGGMLEIRNKLKSIITDPGLTTLEQRQNAMEAWFFGKDEIGFTHYLYGEEGISNPRVNAGTLEMKILSMLFHHHVQYHTAAHSQNVLFVNGFVKPEDIVELPPLGFHMEHAIGKMSEGADHWNALLPDTEFTKRIKIIYEQAQYPKAIRRRECRDKREVLREGLRRFDTFEKHCQSIPLPEEDYCDVYLLSESQFRANSLPDLESMIKEDAWRLAHGKRPKSAPKIVIPPPKASEPAPISSALALVGSAASAVSAIAGPMVSTAAATVSSVTGSSVSAVSAIAGSVVSSASALVSSVAPIASAEPVGQVVIEKRRSFTQMFDKVSPYQRAKMSMDGAVKGDESSPYKKAKISEDRGPSASVLEERAADTDESNKKCVIM